MVHESSCSEVTTPRMTMSRLSSWAVVLEEQCALKCPFRLHLGQVDVSLVGVALDHIYTVVLQRSVSLFRWLLLTLHFIQNIGVFL